LKKIMGVFNPLDHILAFEFFADLSNQSPRRHEGRGLSGRRGGHHHKPEYTGFSPACADLDLDAGAAYRGRDGQQPL
jgi:hypothetical protein